VIAVIIGVVVGSVCGFLLLAMVLSCRRYAQCIAFCAVSWTLESAETESHQVAAVVIMTTKIDNENHDVLESKSSVYFWFHFTSDF